MSLFKKKCGKCYGSGVVVHPVKPEKVSCDRCKGKGKIRK